MIEGQEDSEGIEKGEERGGEGEETLRATTKEEEEEEI